ncbi:TPA: hypothetical protein HH831_004963 [Escherichia coli]|nr:hypothetical protein [Escherichia coli]
MRGQHSTARIYHNVALRAPLKRAECDFGAKTMKTTVYPAKTRQNRSERVYGL